jgi:hypothetical protein
MKSHRKALLRLLAPLIVGSIGYTAWKHFPVSVPEGQRRKVVCYQDSMHPWVKSDRPGKCTVCAMDLTPIYQGEQGFGGTNDLVILSSNSVTVLNVQTEEVKRQPLRFSLRVAGILDADETHKAIFSAPAAGRIEEMAVESVGDEVEVEQRLFTFYSPELATWRRAYVIRNRSSTLTTPFFAGKPHEGTDTSGRPKPGSTPRTAAPGAPASDATDTDPYFSDLLSPLSGTVVERKVFNGQYVAEGDRLLTIVDTSVLWFRFDVYERQLPWLQKGQRVRVTVSAVPDREFSGVISVIEPTLDDKTRTVKVRADILNPLVGDAPRQQRLLRLGMYADGQVLAELPAVLTLPRAAILFPGDRAYAYVEQAPGVFAMRSVKLGRQGDSQCELLGGLEEGDRVVTSGNVLIDAQAQFTQPSHEATAKEEMPLMAAVERSGSMTEPARTERALAGQHQKHASAAMSEPAARQEASPQEQAPGRRHPKPRRPAAELTVGTANNRHPEARELMARSFAVGLAEKHRAAGGRSLVSHTAAAELPMQGQQEACEALAIERMRSSASTGLAAHNSDRSTPIGSVNLSAIDGPTEEQRTAMMAFLAVADGISRALAADDLADLNQQVSRLSAALSGIVKEFPKSDPWHERLEGLASASDWAAARNLEEARKCFLPFSTSVVAVAKLLKKWDSEFAGLKIYYCPMAPKPGLWLQAKGPLSNPFYGSRMLRCGEEVTQ